MKTFSIRKRVCTTCETPRAPYRMHRVDDRFPQVCTACVNQIHSGSPAPTEEVSSGRAAPESMFIDAVHRYVSVTRIWWLLRTLLRTSFYLSTFFLLSPGMTAYPVLQGAAYADLVTWLTFSVFEMSFRGLTFVVDFCLYGGLVTVFMLQHQEPMMIPEEPNAFAVFSLTFLAVTFAKIVWWCTKVFILEEE